MPKQIFYGLFLVLFFNQTNSFQLITNFDNASNVKKNSLDLDRFSACLQKNLNLYLIDTIHVFYVNPPANLPSIFKDKRIKIISLDQPATFKQLFNYANTNLASKRVIITGPQVYFDESLFKLNYYPMDDQFMCLSLAELALNPGQLPTDYKAYDSFIFTAPTPISIPKDLKWDAIDGEHAIQIIASNTDNLIVTNPALDVLSYQISNNTPHLKPTTNKLPRCSKINITCSPLAPFNLTWDLVKKGSKILLYDRNMHCLNPDYCTPAENPSCYKFACLSLNKNNSTHILHDLASYLPLPDNCVDVFQTEDVLEHRPYDTLVNIINEIYRVLRPGGLCRISVPDYRCDLLYNRSIKDHKGNIVFDPQGGGRYENGQVVAGGHLWFPDLENMTVLLSKTLFNKPNKVSFLHYYTNKKSITHPIDYSICYVRRTPDHDGRVSNPYRGMSMVIDLIK